MNSNFSLAKSSYDKKTLQHYPSKGNFNIDVFRLLHEQPLVIEHTIVPVVLVKAGNV